MKNCKYKFNGIWYSYEELVLKFEDLYTKNIIDFIYQIENPVAEDLKTRLMDLKNKYIDEVRVRKKGAVGEVDVFGESGKYTPLTFMDSGRFVTPLGSKIIEPIDIDAARKAIINLKKELLNGDEAKATEEANKIIDHWDTISEDGALIHKYLGKGFNGEISKARLLLHGTSFEDIYDKLYALVEEPKVNIFLKPHGVLSGFISGATRRIKNLNLKCKLTGSDEEIVGHIDNLIIADDGTLHIVNYKVSTVDFTKDSDRMERYKYELALLKLMLEYHGFSTKNMTLSIIPIRLEYNDDFTKVVDIIADPKLNVSIKNGQYVFTEYDRVAQRFIVSNATINKVTSTLMESVNKLIRTLWPNKDISSEGILLTIDEWIERNPHNIVQVTDDKTIDEDKVHWKVILSDEDVIEVHSPDRPKYNQELKDKLQAKHEKLNLGNSYIGSNAILRLLRASLKGKNIVSFSDEKGFAECGKYLDKLFYPYLQKNEEGEPIWSIVEDDLVSNANIILLRNKITKQLDVITISPLNLDVVATFRGGYHNILGQYMGDTEAMNRDVPKATYGNIEAYRTMFVLNLILANIEGTFHLGTLQVVSPINVGHSRVYSIKELAQDFQGTITVVNNNNSDIKITNNFVNYSFLDSLESFLLLYENAISDETLGPSNRVNLKDWGIENLTTATTKEVKQNILRNLVKSMESVWKLPMNELALNSFASLNKDNKAKVALYKMALRAMLAYDGILDKLDLNESDMASVDYYYQGATYIPSRNARIVTSLFHRTVDKIAEQSYNDSRPVLKYLTEFYKAAGYSNLLNSVIGNQASAFKNLFEEVDGKRTMRFKNPYTDPTLEPYEAKFLKLALFTFAKIRLKMFPTLKFDFTNWNDPGIKEFIEKNEWYLEAPLTKASKATKRVTGYAWQDFKNRVGNLLTKSGQILNFEELFEGITSDEEKELLREDMSRMSITNHFSLYDSRNSYGGRAARTAFLNRHEQGFFETNVETLLINMIESLHLAEEMGTFLLQSRAILTTLGVLGDVGTPRLKSVMKYITNYVNVNVFNKSIMEESSKRIMNLVLPGRHLATTLYIAGNLVSGVRDLTEGLMQNMMRSVIKYQTNISTTSLAKAYKEVVKGCWSNVRSINILNLLNAFYRISNVDVARIQEVLATGRGGAVNYENWLYATMRRPDFINRMTLFVARMMEDGVWDAISLNEDGDLKYDCKKDKRFYAYFHLNESTLAEYLKAKGLYFSSIMEYNREHPEATLTYNDELPRPYSFELVESIKTVANSIYGGYDKSVKAMYEHVALGVALGQFTTWMNGMVGNYFRKPGTATGEFKLVQGTNLAGELQFIHTPSLNIVVEKTREDGTKYYFDESTGQEVVGEVVPYFKNVPILGQGIMYTVFKSIPKAIKVGYARGGLSEAWNEYIHEIWQNPEERKNLKKLLSDMLMWFFMSMLFKFALNPAYKDWKNSRDKDNLVANGVVDIMYKGFANSYDGFRGPYNVIDTLGNNMNPPAYKAPANLVTNLVKFPFDEDKTVGLLITQNAPLFRGFAAAYNQYVK